MQLPGITNQSSDEGEQDEAAETTNFTTQAYTAPVMLAASEGEEQAVSLVQTKINDALSAVTGTLTGRIQVLLTRGVSYDGDVSISKEEIGREVADDFEIEIAEETPADELEAALAPAKYIGTMNIKGINVAINGIGLTGMVNVESAKLSYTGTDGKDTVNVTAGEEAQVDVKTGAGDDTVTANAIAGGTLDVDTGAGDDTVTSNVNEASATIRTGDGDDNVDATFDADLAPATMDIDSGDGNDKVKLTDDALKGKATIKTGIGDDTVAVDAHNGGIAVDAGAGIDNVILSNSAGKTPVGQIDVTLGDGSDMVSVDMSLSGAVSDVNVKDGTDQDVVIFTGSLGDAENRVTGDAKKLHMVGSDGHTLNVNLSGTENLAESLENKETVKLTPYEGTLKHEADKIFTNYEITVPAKDIKDLKVTGKDGKDLLLSNVVINVATDVDGKNKLVISEGAIIDVRGLTVDINSENVEVNGTIIAQNVNIKAETGNKFLNVTGEAKIVITDKAAIYTSGDVMILAKVTKSGPMLNSDPEVPAQLSGIGLTLDISPINAINVKIARASVDIAGKVFAGVANIDAVAADPKNAKPEFGFGSVTANAETEVTMGGSDDGAPVAVNVALVDAKVNVAKGADVEAGLNVALASKSTLNAGTRASSGLIGAPFAVAVAVLTNDAHTTVNGTVNAHYGSASITADGTLEANTVADRGDGQGIISGGYGAVTVALQDVKAVVNAGAEVKAGDTVTIESNAIENVVDKAASSSLKEPKEPEPESTFVSVVGGLLGMLKDKLLSLFSGDSDVEKQINKALQLLPVSDKSVQLDSKATQKGQVSADVVTENGKTKLKLGLEPWEGYEVESVTVRFYSSGIDAWKVKTLSGKEIAGKKQVELDALTNNMIVFVNYKEKAGQSDDDWHPSNLFGDDKQDDDELDEDTWRPSDLFDLDDVMNNVQNGTNAGGEEGADADAEVELKLGSGVLTYDFLPDSPEKNLEKVRPGSALRLIPNPAEGQKLKEGGLKATYIVKEGDKNVKKVVSVTPDAQGRYIFNVPEDFAKGEGISVSAEFEDGAQDEAADESQTQVTGTVAVTVAHNDSQALVDKDATIVAGGNVDANSTITTDVDTSADGSAVSKDEIPAAPDSAPASYAIARPEKQDFDGYADYGELTYGVKLGERINGDVEFKQDPNKPYTFIFTPKPIEGYDVASATLTYYTSGEAHTVELKKAADGTYRLELEKTLNFYELKEDCYIKPEVSTEDKLLDIVVKLFQGTFSMGIDKGTNLTVDFTFASEKEQGVLRENHAAEAVLPHIIGIKYNSLKGEDEKPGSITYKEIRKRNGVTYYVFNATAEEDKGYALDGTLKATWAGDGSAELVKMEDGYWYLDSSVLPENEKVTVTGAFKEELRDFKTSDDIKNGSVTLYDEQVKKADKPRFTVKPDAGYSVDDITITYTTTNLLGLDKEVTLKLSDEKSKITKVKDGDGLYTFTVEDVKEGAEIKVKATFKLKTIGIYAGASDADASKYKLSEKNVSTGDIVIVTPTDKDIKAGKKVGEVKVEVQGKPSVTVKVNADGSFEVPKDLKDTDKLTVTEVSIVNKDVAMKGATLEHGSVTPDVPYADAGETVTVTVKPEDNFKVKNGTLKAIITSADGMQSEEVMLRRKSDTSYAFIMPVTGSNVSLTFEGEFVPGQSDSSQVNTSIGAGIAVSVVNSESRADVKGSVTGADVKLKSDVTGNVATESKAGYSAGNIGVGGAVSVQVASVDSKALVHNSAALTTNGELSVTAANAIDYKVNADAAGDKEAQKTGVGAGIAVAVNGADTYAAVNDNAKLEGTVKSIAVTANHTLQDAVTAKAGASGGSAGVPWPWSMSLAAMRRLTWAR